MNVPSGSRFKGYRTILVRDLSISADLICYRRERWLTPEGKRIIAPLPEGLLGGFGANLRRFCLALHAQGQVTTERLTAILNGIGMDISKRQVVRILTSDLDGFVAEDQAILRAGLATAPYISVDDTGARHAHRDEVTTQIGGSRFDPMRIPMRVNETHHHFDRRSSSAIAKYADAFRRISLAWRSSRFSRSSAFMRSAISLETPGRLPRLTSAFLTQSFSVCGVQPIFAAIEITACQRDGC